jgi:hypothetical protein
MVPSVFTPVLAIWYLLFLHLFWQQKVPYCQNRCKNKRYHIARTGVKTEGTIMPEEV